MTLESYLTAAALAATVAAVVAGNIIWAILSNVLTSPIPPSVPGPFLARLTSKWILFVDMSGYRARTVDALHKKYGPVVRLAPNELSFSCREAIQPIYGTKSTCIKGPIYDYFGKRGLFQMKDAAEHRERQRRMAHIFSAGSLQQMEPLVQSVVERTVSAIEKTSGQVCDALHFCRMMALDVAGEVLMGKSFGAFDGQENAPIYVKHLDNAYPVWFIQGIVPLLYQLLKMLPIPALQKFMAAGDYVYKYGNDAFEEFLKLNGRTSNRRTLLTKLIAGNPETGAEPLPDADIITEISNLTFAAVDTTGNTGAYALYRLACHPDWQRKLQAEIRNSGARGTNFAYLTLQTLPVLNGVLMETLRLHPAQPSGPLRETTHPSTNIAGLNLPAKTLVSVQSYTTQRDPAYFPDPDQFNPGRWINADGTINPGTPELQDMMLVWGKGTRTCAGQYMATMELKILLARLMDQGGVALHGERTHADMEMTDHFVLIPKGHYCGLVFTRE
ncbi:cytochrome P450 [Chaetomium sp. MPI-CAGE-AT-0009]|nr:cytochrome P450 [Chaetomium sp. MPI-CAGE-AT-0009]